jgi:hypothetical protein
MPPVLRWRRGPGDAHSGERLSAIRAGSIGAGELRQAVSEGPAAPGLAKRPSHSIGPWPAVSGWQNVGLDSLQVVERTQHCWESLLWGIPAVQPASFKEALAPARAAQVKGRAEHCCSPA